MIHEALFVTLSTILIIVLRIKNVLLHKMYRIAVSPRARNYVLPVFLVLVPPFPKRLETMASTNLPHYVDPPIFS